MSETTTEWVVDANAPTDQRRRRIAWQEYGYISKYEGSENYNWQTRRGDGHLSGIVTGAEAAMAHADAMLALPVEEFNAMAAIGLRDEIANLEKKLLALQPGADLLPGYHAGFEAGMAAMKAKVEAVLS